MNEFKKDLITAIETVCDAYKEEEPKPTFKVGQWVVWEGNGPTIGRIEKHCPDFVDSWSLVDTVFGKNRTYTSCSEKYLRLATKEEIKAHLMKIADEKYVGKKVKSVCNKDYIETIKCFYYYEEENDEMIYTDIHDCQMTVYSEGKWAEIVPEKKKLPKTNEELKTALYFWGFNRHSIDEFMNQFEL